MEAGLLLLLMLLLRGELFVVVGQTRGPESGRCWESCPDRGRTRPLEKAAGGRLPCRKTVEWRVGQG